MRDINGSDERVALYCSLEALQYVTDAVLREVAREGLRPDRPLHGSARAVRGLACRVRPRLHEAVGREDCDAASGPCGQDHPSDPLLNSWPNAKWFADSSIVAIASAKMPMLSAKTGRKCRLNWRFPVDANAFGMVQCAQIMGEENGNSEKS